MDDARTRRLFIENMARRDDFQDVCGNWKTNPHRLADFNLCIIGPNASRKVLFWGDSHVQQLYPAVNHLYNEGDLQGHGAIFAVANSYPPVENMNVPREDLHCDAFFPLVMTIAKEKDIDTVFIGFYDRWLYDNSSICRTVNGKCLTGDSVEMLRALFFSELTAQIRQLQSLGKRVIICMPFPVYDASVPSLEIHNAVFSRFGLARVAKKNPLPDFSEQILEVSRATGAASSTRAKAYAIAVPASIKSMAFPYTLMIITLLPVKSESWKLTSGGCWRPRRLRLAINISRSSGQRRP